MHLRLYAFAALVLSCTSWPAAYGQRSVTGLIEPGIAGQFGLERMWFTNLTLDRGRALGAGMHLHVSATEAHTLFQIAHDGKRHVFSQHDRNAFGDVIGIEGAKQQAEEKLAAIKAELAAAGQKETQPPAIEAHVVPKTTLYVTSQRATVHAIDAETGRTLWSAAIGNPLLPTTAPGANDKYVAACNGSKLYVLRAEDGSFVWSRTCVGAPGAGPALSDELIFVPMVGGQIETLLLEEPKRPMATFKSFGRTMVQPVVSHNSVAWPTNQGNLYVALAHEPGMRFRLEASDAIDSSPAFLPPDKVFVTSRDGYIYCVHEQRGSVLWRFTTGEPISHAPVALASRVYAITQRGNMFAVDVNTASEIWVIPGMRHYLAGNEKRLYCLDTAGNVAILDTLTGSRLGTIAVRDIDLPLLNVQTDRIILASSSGLIQCFREIDRPFPILHYRAEPKPQQQLTRRSPTAEPKPADATDAAPAPLTSDPFAAPGTSPATPSTPAADPFAPP